jgi:hypothetical protein
MYRRAFGIVVLLLAARSVAAADLVVRQRVTSDVNGRTSEHESTEYLTPTQSVHDDAGNRVAVDLRARTLTLLDKKEHTYSVTPLDEVERRSAHLAAEMQKRLANLPPEARRMIAGAEGAATVKPTGKTARIAGYEAKEYAVEAGGAHGSVWVTDALERPGDLGDWQRYAQGTVPGPAGKLVEAMARIKGFPLRTTITQAAGPMRMSTTTEVLEVRKETPPADVLTIPDGYRKTEGPFVKEPPSP